MLCGTYIILHNILHIHIMEPTQLLLNQLIAHAVRDDDYAIFWATTAYQKDVKWLVPSHMLPK